MVSIDTQSILDFSYQTRTGSKLSPVIVFVASQAFEFEPCWGFSF